MKYIYSTLVLFTVSLFAANDNQYLLDRNISPYAMGENFLSAFNANLFLQDIAVPPKDPPVRSVAAFFGRLIFGITGSTIIADPITTFQHEFAGHGYRCRDIGSDKCKVTGYQYHWMLGGATLFEFDTEKASLGDLNAIAVAGIEADNILARQLKMQWLKNNYIEPRTVPLYQTQLRLLFYATTLVDADVESNLDFFVSDKRTASCNQRIGVVAACKIAFFRCSSHLSGNSSSSFWLL